ncbi:MULTISPECIES: transglutaminase family protein [unclassified Oceanispirochaeta]|uniref:transglutaminase-like domain-containing protein n=1 Tax=unclassified Oceanispirochaeta TaxID=2635722 RepID=UPI000E097A67|nr:MULTISPECIES: transglutaminase domain-containing protein [unclassified Oceanispirochaeta]MBF9014669.1 transglutaminase domain-containing protein [Oceanispirochaeta sp. M2]NPD70925.1 transglutaminase domain-containing protein [Oceanispirochaeta sp. M1]RDG33759.1 hypothetical protein DV872_02335 [Oceanispirochaeta sp. M1]
MPGLFLIPLLVYLSIHLYLDSTAPLWFPLLIELPLILTILEIKLFPRWRTALFLRTARIAAFTILITGFLMFILMLPESLYQAWLLLLEAGKATGMISFAFAYAGGLVSSIGCASLLRWKNKIQALLNLLLLCIMVVLILHPRLIIFSTFMILLIIKLLVIQKKNPRTMRLLSISITLIPAVTAAFLFPLFNEEPRGSRVVDKFSRGVQSTVSRVFPELPLLLQIPGYGYGYDQVRETGERPFLSSNVVFTLDGEAGTVLYLRSDVFYNYMTGGWISEIPGTGEREAEVPDENIYRKIRLTVETDIYTRVLHNSWTRYYLLDHELMRLDSQGSFELPSGLPLRRGDMITLYDSSGKAPVPDEETLKRQIERSTLLPADMKDSLSGLAESLEGDSYIQSLSNIKNYLREDFKYTLDTKSSENMVLNFLNETKVGYCVHFSTTAALLARTLGIPVRMAEGFLVQIPNVEDGYIYSAGSSHGVTGYSAHQWPEILVEGRGWMPWEVTPPFEALGDSLVQEDSIIDAFTREQLQRMGLFRQGDEEPLNASGKVRAAGIALIILLSVMCAIFSLFLLYRASGLNGVMKRKTRKAFKKYGISYPETIGWVQWFRNIQTSRDKKRCLNLVLRYCYHKDSLERVEKKELLKLLRKL